MQIKCISDLWHDKPLHCSDCQHKNKYITFKSFGYNQSRSFNLHKLAPPDLGD